MRRVSAERPKDRCLTHCRAPIALSRPGGRARGAGAGALAARDPAARGAGAGALAARDLGAGVRHGAYWLGCCWALMVILIAVGVMNVAAMAGLAAVVLIERTWRWGPAAGRVAGVAALGLAVAVIWLPWLAPGLHAAPPMMMG